MTRKLLFTALTTVVAASTLGCTDEAPNGLKRTPDAPGNPVSFDLYHKPLPEVPLPNDVALWPDPTSRTGVRVNASLVAPTNIERDARERFDELEGWGTFGAITMSFDKDDPSDDRAAIDLENFISMHIGDDYELENDAIYLVNLETGIPAVLDIGEGAFQYTVRQKDRYWRNDTRRLEQNLMWDTVDEAVDPETGRIDPDRLVYKPEYDTDFDGILDRPNLADVEGCPNQAQVTLGMVTELERDQCFADKLLTFYERETDSLIMRPLVPLEEKTRYAVVVTDRLVDYDGRPVKSPFEFVYHPSQVEAIEKLQEHMSNPDLASYYGDIGGTGLERVAFTWTFTTMPIVEDLRILRDGLYGAGPFAHVSDQFPPDAELFRMPGLLQERDFEQGIEEEPGWEDMGTCAAVSKDFYAVDFDAIRGPLRTMAQVGFGLDGRTLDHLTESFEFIKFLVIGQIEAPFYIEGGPEGTAPGASFELDYQNGEGQVHRDKVQFMLTIPKETAEHKQPFPVALYGHGYTSSSVEALGFAGDLARQGIAHVGWNATFHGLEFDPATETQATFLFKANCLAPFADALLANRARDLDADVNINSGGDYWTSYLFHTRDVVRQSALDQLALIRAFKAFGEKNAGQDYNQNGELDDLLGDMDGNGVPDIGGPNVEYYTWGQSLGGILAPFAAALDPDVVATAPTSGSGGLLDVGVRTFQGGAFEGIYLRNFGPMIVSVPVEEVGENTQCAEGQNSLRFIVLSVNNDREVELGCLDLDQVQNGGTIVAANRSNGEVRCSRIGMESPSDGRFRIGIPSSFGDSLEIQIYDQPDAVDTYEFDVGCNVPSDIEPIRIIDEWGAGPIADGETIQIAGEDRECSGEGGCIRFEDQLISAGDPLHALVEGFGHVRQTPRLRRFMNLAGHVVDAGDPINMAPYYGLRPLVDWKGERHPATGLVNITTIGDMNVPLNSGIAMARAAGAIPFLRPDAVDRYPGLADYVTPQEIFEQLGGKTPNRALIDSYVMEGINRLQRHAGGSCAPNEVPLTEEDVECHAVCSEPGSSNGCGEGQVCNDDRRCVAREISPEQCAQYLFDPDVIDEGLANHGEAEAAMPLRLGRISMPADPSNATAVWEPRIAGSPFMPDQGAWQADQRIVASLQAYVEPTGVHGFFITDPCDAFQTDRYLINMIGRFFRTSGSDLYYLSHPTTHKCLARPSDQGGCNFVAAPPEN